MYPRSLAFLALLVPATAGAEDTRPARPDWNYNLPPFEFNTRIFDFPTGLRIMFQEDHSAPVVLVQTIVNSGGNHDPVGKEETAHFCEHAWFRSKHGDLPSVMELIQDIGARFNATTRNDWTDYRTVANSQFLPLLLQLESARLVEPYAGITEDNITIEREVIRNEWRLRNEQSYALLFDHLSNAVYPDSHPYGRTSTHDSLTAIDFPTLKGYFDTWYKPEHTTIMVVGDFDMETVNSLIYENFAPHLLHEKLTEADRFYYPRPGIKTPVEGNPDHWLTGVWEPGQRGVEPLNLVPLDKVRPRITDVPTTVADVATTEIMHAEAAVDYTTVLVGTSMPGGFRQDEWTYALAANITSGFVASQFTEETSKKWIRDIGCFPQGEIENTTFMCLAEVANTDRVDPELVGERMIDAFVELWNPDYHPIFEASLSRAKQEILRDQLLNIDVVAAEFGARPEESLPHTHYTGSATSISDSMNKVMAISTPEITRAAFEFLKRDRTAIVIVKKLESDEIDTTNQKSAYLGASAADTIILNPSEDVAKMSDAQIASEYAKPDLSKLIDVKLDNGLRVLILPHGEAPVIQATLAFGGGTWEEPFRLRDFAADFVRSQGHDPLPIAAAPTYLVIPPSIFDTTGSGWAWPMIGTQNPNVGSNHWTMGVRAPSGNVDGALWLLREEMETQHPFVDGKLDYEREFKYAIEGNIKKRKTGIWDDMAWHIAKARNEHMFPDSLHSRVTTWDDLKALESWGATDIDKYLANHVKPSNAVLLLIGNVDGAAALEEVKHAFAGWKAKPGADSLNYFELATPKPAVAGAKILLYDDPSVTQSSVVTNCRVNYAGNEDEAAVGVLSSLLFNRAFFTLRVQEALAYSPVGYTTTSSDNTATVYFNSTALNTGVGRTVEVFLNTIADVEKGRLTAEEIKLIKLREARSNGVSLQSVDQLTSALLSIAVRQESPSRLLDQGDRIAGVQPADLSRITQGCVNGSITTIAGPIEIIKPQLDERGYAYEVIEHRGLASELLLRHDPKGAALKEKYRIKDEAKKARDDDKEAEKAPEK